MVIIITITAVRIAWVIAADIGAGAVRALLHEFIQLLTAVLALDVATTAHPTVVAVGHGEGTVIVGIGALLPGQQGLWRDF